MLKGMLWLVGLIVAVYFGHDLYEFAAATRGVALFQLNAWIFLGVLAGCAAVLAGVWIMMRDIIDEEMALLLFFLCALLVGAGMGPLSDLFDSYPWLWIAWLVVVPLVLLVPVARAFGAWVFRIRHDDS